MQYEICNQSSEVIRVAPWEISRVPGGLTVFAHGEGCRDKPAPVPEPVVTNALGATWLAYSRAAITTDQKLFAHSNEGWLAHFWNGFRIDQAIRFG